MQSEQLLKVGNVSIGTLIVNQWSTYLFSYDRIFDEV